MRRFLSLLSAAALTAAAANLTIDARAAGEKPDKSASQPSSTLRITPLDAPGFRQKLAALRGHVVVVNLWATWCSPCVEEFPYLARLQKAEKAKGLELVTISFDEVKDIPGKVSPFLAKNGVIRGAFINTKGSNLDESWVKLFEPKLPADDAFGLPRTYIYDRTGKLVKALSGGQTYAAFQSAVRPFLTPAGRKK